MARGNFWDYTWISEEKTRRTEIIGLVMQKDALDYSYNRLGNIEDKKLLEIGCGSGLQTIYFCKKRAAVTAIDLSEESIKLIKNLAKRNKLKNLNAIIMKAEELQFPDNSFDFIYINCVLMHTQKERVLKECLRTLKPDGLLVIKETLKYWIFAFPYRFFSPYKKTKPNYITLREINNLKAEHKEFYLFSTFFLFLFYLLKNEKLALSIFNVFAKFDDFILEHIPFLRYISWVTVAIVRK